MNIRILHPEDTIDIPAVSCPNCHSIFCRKHGFYSRKAFHGSCAIEMPMHIQRYRCLNQECPCSTFSILPPMVIRYCRFFWPCLLAVWKAIDSGSTAYLLSYVWHVSRGVILRAAALRGIMCPWVENQYQELTDGKQGRNFALMVKIIIAKIGRLELLGRWFCHRYPARFFGKIR